MSWESKLLDGEPSMFKHGAPKKKKEVMQGDAKEL